MGEVLDCNGMPSSRAAGRVGQQPVFTQPLRDRWLVIRIEPRKESRQRPRIAVCPARATHPAVFLLVDLEARIVVVVVPAAIEKFLPVLFDLRPASLRQAGDARKSWEGDLTNRLRDFFSAKRLNQITADDIRQFQAQRLGNGKHPSTVNHEVKALFRLLKRAKLLSRLRDDIRLLPVKEEPKSILTEAEKQRLWETASKRPEWMVAYCAALITANTSMRPVELRRLLWSDLNPFDRLVTVRRSKTEAGTRVIPLNDLAWSAFAAMKQRADSLGTYAPEHYVFHREWPAIDPKHPMSGWRTAWRSLREAAAKGKY